MLRFGPTFRGLLAAAVALVVLGGTAEAQHRPGFKSHDALGRLIAEAGDDGRLWRYTHLDDGSREVWVDGQTVGLEKPDGTVEAYAFDGMGRKTETRITKPGSAPRFIRHETAAAPPRARPRASALSAAVMADESAPSATYQRDEFGRLVRITDSEGSTTYSYFEGTEDPVIREVRYPDGSRATFDEEVARAARAALGAPSTSALSPAAAPSDPCSSSSRFLFTSYVYDCELGLYLTPSGRMYDPRLGRFLQADSYLGSTTDPPSLHRYLYAHANPTRFVDPDGHAARVIQTDPRRTGYTVAPGGYTQALTYETTVTVTDDQPAAYALPQAVGRQVAPLNTVADDAVSVPVNVLTVGGASGMRRAIRERRASLNDPAALARAYTEGNANALTFGGVDAYVEARAGQAEGVASSILAGGTGAVTNALPIEEGRTLLSDDASGYDKAKALAKGGLRVVSLAMLARGAVAGRNAGGAPAAIVEESAAPGRVTHVRVLDQHFTPDPTRVLQNITTTQAEALAADPALAQAVLSRREYLAGQRSVPVARLQYGNAVERLAAREIAQPGSVHQQLFERVGGPHNPDFIGRGLAVGRNFDITTPGQVNAHLARPGYGPGLNVVTYQRSPLFRLFP